MGVVSVGALTTGVLATVDERGTVVAGAVSLRWPVRAARLGPAPIAEHAVRVRGGDAIARVYGVGDHRGLVVVEVENASPEAIAVAFVVGGRRAEDTLALPRRAGAIESDGALVFPVPHQTVLRVAMGDPQADVRTLPEWNVVRRGWDRVLDQGMRTELPEPWQTQIDAARADVLLAAPSSQAFTTLEAWGFDDEAAAMWPRLSMRARRAARQRRAGTGQLDTLHRMLVHADAGRVLLLPGFRREWLGANLAVQDVPLREGALSFALRWHGARPALLWEAPQGIAVCMPALAPNWSSTEPVGETLLAAPAGREPVSVPESFS
jgi:hypothetical protein